MSGRVDELAGRRSERASELVSERARGHAGWASGGDDEQAGEQAGRQSEQARGLASRVNSAMKKSNHNRICFAIDDGMIANQ